MMMKKSEYDFAQILIDDINAEIGPSKDAQDRGYNAGLRKAARIIRKYREDYEASHFVVKED